MSVFLFIVLRHIASETASIMVYKYSIVLGKRTILTSMLLDIPVPCMTMLYVCLRFALLLRLCNRNLACNKNKFIFVTKQLFIALLSNICFVKFPSTIKCFWPLKTHSFCYFSIIWNPYKTFVLCSGKIVLNKLTEIHL